MSYLKIQNFKYGLDTRRDVLSSQVGTLGSIVNGHINQGGEIEKRQKFDLNLGSEVADSFGCQPIMGGFATYVNGSPSSDIILGDSVTVIHSHQLDPGSSGYALAGIVHSCSYNGNDFVIARFSKSASADIIRMFYNGSLITDASAPTDGNFCYVRKGKVYVMSPRKVSFCAFGDPTDWSTTGDGAGTQDLSTGVNEDETFCAIASYQEKLAFFSDRSIQIWTVDTDPTKWERNQILTNTGTIAPKSIASIGDMDTIYLSASGIRSLRVRESTLNAINVDIGSPIDTTVLAKLATCTSTQIAAAYGTIDPVTGRYMLYLKDTFYVLSYYPTLKITAWSTYDATGYVSTLKRYVTFTVSWMGIYRQQVFILVTYQGEIDPVTQLGCLGEFVNTNSTAWSGIAYDASELSWELPWLDMDSPATIKTIHAMDAIFNGVWSFYGMSSYRDPKATWTKIVENVGYATPEGGRIPYPAVTTHVRFKGVTNWAGRATFSNMLVLYQKGNEK